MKAFVLWLVAVPVLAQLNPPSGGGSGGNVNVTGINGVAPAVGSGTANTGTLRTILATDQPAFNINAAQSGSWVVGQSGSWNIGLLAGVNLIGKITLSQGGNDATISAGGALKVDGSGSTQPISGSVSVSNFPATYASVQSGTWSMRMQDGSGNALASSTSAPTGTEQALIVRNIPSGTQTISGTVTANAGSGTMAVSAASLPLPTGASTLAEQQTQTTALQLLDDVVGLTGATAPTRAELSGQLAKNTQPTAATDGQMVAPLGTLDGAQFMRLGGPITWTCALNAIAASLTQCQAAPGAGLSLYIQSLHVQTTTTTSGTYALQSGTGANCGTGTTAVFPASATGNRFNAPITSNAMATVFFPIPIKLTANHALCLIGVATNTISAQIVGFTAP